MSLKTPESALHDLRLPYQIVYDDEESRPCAEWPNVTIAWLYSDHGEDIGSWSGTMVFTLCEHPASNPTTEELVQLSAVLRSLRSTADQSFGETERINGNI